MPTAIASAKTSHVRTVPLKTSAATSDQSPASAIRLCPSLRAVDRVSTALAAAMTVMPVDTPNAVQPATPTPQAIDTTTQKRSREDEHGVENEPGTELHEKHLLDAAGAASNRG